MIKLYHAPGACSFAAHMALEESGLAYEVTRVNLAEGEQRTPAYLAINPKGRVPALADGDFVLTEVPAILRYVSRISSGGGSGRLTPGRGALRRVARLDFLRSPRRLRAYSPRRALRRQRCRQGRGDRQGEGHRTGHLGAGGTARGLADLDPGDSFTSPTSICGILDVGPRTGAWLRYAGRLPAMDGACPPVAERRLSAVSSSGTGSFCLDRHVIRSGFVRRDFSR